MLFLGFNFQALYHLQYKEKSVTTTQCSLNLKSKAININTAFNISLYYTYLVIVIIKRRKVYKTFKFYK